MHSLDAGQCQSSLRAGDLTSGAYYSQRHELVQAIARGLQAGSRAMGCQSGSLDLGRALLIFPAAGPPGALASWGQGFQPIITWRL